jgi:leucyl aminopeptidase (aminopeptidase T)
MSDLDRALAAVVRDCLAVREGERVLVACDLTSRDLGERIREEAADAGADAVLSVMAEREMDGSEPADPVAGAMLRADAVIAVTLKSISHTVARRAANEAGARVATLPGVDADVLARLMSADIDGLRRKGAAVAAALTAASEARITSPGGSDLRLGLTGREGVPDAGDIQAPGAFGNLPCGEGFIAPLEGTAEGTLVVDGTIASYGIPSEPVELTVEAGHLVAASGEAGEWLLGALRGAGEEGTNVAELGVGTNEKATMTENLIEAEKILGTVHVAFGASASIGGTVQVPIHIDCVVTGPDLALDGELIVRGGELLV